MENNLISFAVFLIIATGFGFWAHRQQNENLWAASTLLAVVGVVILFSKPLGYDVLSAKYHNQCVTIHFNAPWSDWPQYLSVPMINDDVALDEMAHLDEIDSEHEFLLTKLILVELGQADDIDIHGYNIAACS